ncbi:putative bifunctional diguanylate cyclase/phosphodiesterase [Streptacidiphilus jiangxiensis]|uniref:PAS domain S-box-containing protein/diguanylate cyclase (GGDEF) domain-containing protein n=1 Tax=Streptacidiphilus jiangxiensis TaxID=235985 RepID=A0A1H8A1K7_STRJI|nr:EAL domain-containing protein [Streptacidiphilus jiangxiensis]SEM64481.1 PAS domain S-box-containing protein/diguanylate cyclase (GGDEF) domain-containing protein [Streptacidiphilus jiangxiensis]
MLSTELSTTAPGTEGLLPGQSWAAEEHYRSAASPFAYGEADGPELEHPDEPAVRPGPGRPAPAVGAEPHEPLRLSQAAARLPRILVMLVCLLYLAGAAYGWGSPGLADFMGDFGLAGAALTACCSCFGYGVVSGGRHRGAWFCFGLSSLMVAVGNGIWGWYECVLGESLPSPSIADFAFLFFAPPAIIGLLMLSNRPRSAANWLCLALDGWLIAGSLLTLSWSLALARTASGDQHSPLRLAVGLAYPLLDILLISMVLGLRFRRQDGNRAAVHTAIVGLALTVFCDAVFTSQSFKDAYHSGELLDAGWFCGSMLLAWAPWAGGGRALTRESVRRPRVASTFSALTPYAATGVCTVGLLYNALGQHHLDRFVLVVSCTVVIALILRQGVMLLDNLALAQRLSHQERHFRSLVQGSSDVIMIADPDGVLRYVSPAAAGVYGRPADELVGTRLPEMVHPDDLGHVLWEVQRYLTKSSTDLTARIECRVRSGAGEWLDVESTVNRYRDGLIFNCRDISERVRLQAQLEHNAFHDALTGLPNRALFLKRGREALVARADRRPDVAVLFVDLDGFKAVNDSAGHQVGDELLALAAQRLRESVREGDTVARLGGDEFAVLLVGGVDREQAFGIAERLRAAVSATYVLAGEEHAVAASIGIAFAEPGVGPESAADLLRSADLAMYQAKKRGKDRVHEYSPELRTELRRRTELDQRLRVAVREGEFTLVHQPIVDLRSGAVAGLAAQARWRSAQGLLLTPAEFLHAAGAGERAVRLARWMVEQAVQQAAERGGTLPVTVRLSPRALTASGLLDAADAALHRFRLPATRLVVELGESGPGLAEGRPHGVDELVQRLARLKQLGVGLVLDGLGGGATPLSELRRLPVDALKLERGVVDGLLESAFLRTLASSVLRIGHELGLETVAEGVDTPEQARVLRDLGCSRGQGLHFAPPMGEDELQELLVDTRTSEDGSA